MNAMALDERQIAAIKYYTAAGHSEINADLRGDGSGNPAIFTAIHQLDKAFEGAAATEPLVTFRGIGSAYARELERRNVGVGAVIQDSGFLSTSMRIECARGFQTYLPGGLVFKILIPKGSKMLDLSPYSSNPDEREILLPRDTKLRVVGYDGVMDLLELEVIEDG